MIDESLNTILKNKRNLCKGSFLNGSKSVMIYGAGNCGKDILSIMSSQGIPVECFLDMKGSSNLQYNGISIMQPDSDSFTKTQRENVCVILAIYNAYIDVMPIISMLKTYGYKNVITFVELYSIFSSELGERFWLAPLNYYDSLEDIITDGYNLWEDDLSKEIFKSVLKYRLTGNHEFSPKPDIGNQYFPKDIPGWQKPTRFVDCGSYDGDTIIQISRELGKIEAIAAFEPDPVNFSRLYNILRLANSPFAKEILLWPCGLWSNSTQLKFSSGKDSGSAISSTGDIIIQCVSMDEVMLGFNPSFIKMDIEGAEYSAILGAKKTIFESKPQLAISLYHRPSDLWQIPLLLKQWNLGYKFYLRVHQYNGFDLVLYAFTNN
jgi:FkbM family methyltransferase